MSSLNNMQNGIEIQTFVFFDLETTGYIQGSNMPKITEISLIALSRNSLLFNKDRTLPRVLHKLTIPVQPQRLIPLEVSQITGLYNDLLEYEQPFDDHIFVLLNSFISRLYAPVCFVAHYGNNFDYPIILSALNSIRRTLSEDILCVDSLIGFKTLLSHTDFNHSNKNISHNREGNISELLDDGFDVALAGIVDSHSLPSTSIGMENMVISTTIKCDMDADCRSMQKINETTPTHQKNLLTHINAYKLFKNCDGLPVKKRLPFTHGRPRNFKLETVYEHLMGRPPLNSHSAEDDCLSLLVCVVQIGESFIHWADGNAVPLTRYAMRGK